MGPTFLRFDARVKAEIYAFATVEHTAARGCANFWLESEQTIFSVAEKHSSNVSPLILCFASGHRTEKHGVNEVKRVV